VSARPIVVTDATPLIALAKIGHLSLLEDLFGKVLTPAAVYAEVVAAGAGRGGAAEIQAARWIQTETVADQTTISRSRICSGGFHTAATGTTGTIGDPLMINYLLTQLDIGEAEAIVLAQERSSASSILNWLPLPHDEAGGGNWDTAPGQRCGWRSGQGRLRCDLGLPAARQPGPSHVSVGCGCGDCELHFRSPFLLRFGLHDTGLRYGLWPQHSRRPVLKPFANRFQRTNPQETSTYPLR
jgi:predicted nucleic acid-binding protein